MEKDNKPFSMVNLANLIKQMDGDVLIETKVQEVIFPTPNEPYSVSGWYWQWIYRQNNTKIGRNRWQNIWHQKTHRPDRYQIRTQ